MTELPNDGGLAIDPSMRGYNKCSGVNFPIIQRHNTVIYTSQSENEPHMYNKSCHPLFSLEN